MKFEGDRIVIKTPGDAVIAADASITANSDGNAELYRSVDESKLPVRMGVLSSSDVVRGLRHIAAHGVEVSDALTPSVATVYLGDLGIRSSVAS